MRDAFSDSKYTTVLAAVATAITNNTAQVCNVIDNLDFDALNYVISLGILSDADATFTVLLEEGNVGTAGTTTLTDAAAVADSDMIGTEAGAGFTFAADGKTEKLGYKGSKRYTRLTITPANNTGNVPIAVIAHQSSARTIPQSTQQV
jgi:hypothetical protein